MLAIVSGVLIAAVLIQGAIWALGEMDEDELAEWLPEWVLDSLESVGIAFDTVDPDHPPFLKGPFDEAAYLSGRMGFTALLRGAEPGKIVDPASRPAAVQQTAQARAAARRGVGAAVGPAWQELGPAPIPNGQTQTVSTAVSGRITAIEIDPVDPNTVYVGTAQGGLYRSTDGGGTWTAILEGSQTLSIGALALAPSDSTILYVGTGEANGSCDSFSGVGLYRINNPKTAPALDGPINPVPTNNGLAQAVGAFAGRSISAIVVHPTSPGTIFVGTAGGRIGMGCEAPLGNTIPPLSLPGLYRSTNATAAAASVAFERIKVSAAGGCFDTGCTGNRNIDALFLDPGDSNTLLAWQNGTSTAGDGGVWRSTNALAAAATVTFTQTFTTTAPNPATLVRGQLAGYRLPASQAVIYTAAGEPVAGTSCADNRQAGALRVSIDGGQTWSAKLTGGGGFCGGQCYYNLGLAATSGPTPAQGDDLILLGGNTSSASCERLNGRSTDGGATFGNADAGLHADTHVIKFAPSNLNVVYHGNDGGVYRSNDAGQTWASLNTTTLRATQFQSLSVHPTDQNFSIGGTQDNGTVLRRSDGSFVRVDFGDGGASAIDQNATDTTNLTMYHTYFTQTNSIIGYARADNIAAASDGNWQFFGCNGNTPANGITCADQVQFYAPMALGPGNPNPVYFGSDRLYRSADKGANHTVVSQVFDTPISAIGISKLNDNVRIVGLSTGGVFYTVNGATTLANLDPAGVIPAKYVARIVFSPTDANTAYITINGYNGGTAAAQSHVWRVTGLSTTPTLTPINGGLPDVPVNALAVDPLDVSHLFIGTDVGVFDSANGGTGWAPYGTGMPVLPIFDMAIPPGSRLLRVGTHGRGLWQTALPNIGVSCTPTRPRVGLTTTKINSNAVSVTLSAVASDPFNRITAIHFGGNAHIANTNAIVTPLGQGTSLQLPADVTLPANSTTYSFVVQRAAAGPTTVALNVTDSCGVWNTFVGFGNSL